MSYKPFDAAVALKDDPPAKVACIEILQQIKGSQDARVNQDSKENGFFDASGTGANGRVYRLDGEIKHTWPGGRFPTFGGDCDIQIPDRKVKKWMAAKVQPTHHVLLSDDWMRAVVFPHSYVRDCPKQYYRTRAPKNRDRLEEFVCIPVGAPLVVFYKKVKGKWIPDPDNVWPDMPLRWEVKDG